MKPNNLLLCSVLAFLLSACSTAKNVVIPKQTFTFDYKTPKLSKLGSSKILVAFIKPNYASSFENLGNSNELFKRFRDAIGADIEELLIDKGFRIKGSYGSFDDMIFEARKETDIAIAIEIAPFFSALEGGWTSRIPLKLYSPTPPKPVYSYSGSVSLVGKIKILGYEPLTHEIIWTKSVDIPSIENINVTTARSYDRALNGGEILIDENIYNSTGKALQAQYSGIMKKIDTHVEPEELNTLKGDIKELKAKKGY